MLKSLIRIIENEEKLIMIGKKSILSFYGRNFPGPGQALNCKNLHIQRDSGKEMIKEIFLTIFYLAKTS